MVHSNVDIMTTSYQQCIDRLLVADRKQPDLREEPPRGGHRRGGPGTLAGGDQGPQRARRGIDGAHRRR